MALTLTGRLLLAASHCYSITAAGPVPAAPPRSALIGYVTPPQGFANGAELIDAGLVGETASEIIVAFRGTLPFSSPDHLQMIRDWMNDIDAPLVNWPDSAGQVHQGFLGSLNDLWPAMSAAIAALVAAPPDKPIYFTGHSKGGALANLAARRYKAENPASIPMVCTFAAARCGDQPFADDYNAAVAHSVRYEYEDDIVPHVPPSDVFLQLFQRAPALQATLTNLTPGYVSVGDLQFIDWSGNIVGDSLSVELQRLSHMGDLVLTGGFEQIINDHSIDAGSGYAQAICPGF